MYKKLTYFGIFIFLVPIIFVIDNSYVTGIGFFGMKAMHGVQYYGIQMFLGLFLIAFFIFIPGHEVARIIGKYLLKNNQLEESKNEKDI